MQIFEGIPFLKTTNNTKTNKLSCCRLGSCRRMCARDLRTKVKGMAWHLHFALFCLGKTRSFQTFECFWPCKPLIHFSAARLISGKIYDKRQDLRQTGMFTGPPYTAKSINRPGRAKGDNAKRTNSAAESIFPLIYSQVWPNEVGAGWLCRCPVIAWEPLRKRAHTQLVRGTLGHSRLSSLRLCGLILAYRVELVCSN